MAEYRDHYSEIRNAGANLVALAVDEPTRSEAVRQQIELPFSILCDTRREVVRAWGLFNPREKGGIALPAVLVIDSTQRVRFFSRDTDAARVPARAVAAFLRGGMTAQAPPPRKLLLLGFLTVFRAARNALRFGVRSPKT